DALARAVPPGGYLFTGAIRREGEGTSAKYYNSLHVLDGFGSIHATFDKFHLVPFGEYDPFRNILPLGRIVSLPGSFYAGPGPQTIALEGLAAFSPLICYEVIFSGEVVPSRGDRPGWIMNITNDAWFGDSTGPYQHLVAAKLRAVEEGLPLVRAANTGISAVVDPYGRMIGSLELGTSGILDADLPAPIPSRTVYSFLGNGMVGILVFVLVFLGFLLRKRRF
ncbi:MAG: apolipoprotein N-acyltransferase, partial [Kiloniellales bacterium]|nr:apolipoprotein N-acyltransferase [Kiloniellales bacterium]